MMDAPTQTGPANPATEPMAVKKAAKPATKKAAVKKVPANKPAAKKAGNRDLSAAVKAVHSGTKRTATRVGVQADIDLAKVDPQLLLAAGDLPTRKAFWDFDVEKPFTRDGRKVHLDIGRQARIPDYMTRDGKRTQRSMITIPPKLREQIRILFGVDRDEDALGTTAIIALASWAAERLVAENKRLVVNASSHDPHADQRKQVRRAINQLRKSRGQR